ncbi:nipped-B-like protein A [Schistocerca americana]|uniref:nipped-B-like protein A n=1 Tax=Schistocerca americana TaxID=7009 RepID=UPI001F4FDE91|nr:nipped-B-like protein A [Schistocerca americana]
MKKFMRILTPVVDKIDPEKVKRARAYQRFTQLVDDIADVSTDVIYKTDSDVTKNAIIRYENLLELKSCAAELKERGYIHAVPSQKLIKLLSALQMNIRVAVYVSVRTDPDDDPFERKLLHEVSSETVMRGMTACITALSVLTSPNVPKKVCLEEILDVIITFLENQMQHTIYPFFDLLSTSSSKTGPTNNCSNLRRKKAGTKKQHTLCKEGSDRITAVQVEEQEGKAIKVLYHQIVNGICLLMEVVALYRATPQHISAMCSLSVSPFFINNIAEIQLAALRLLGIIFSTYEKFRHAVLGGLLASTMKSSCNNQILRTYKIDSSGSIQMLTAVVLQLVQCSVDMSTTLMSESDIQSVLVKKHKAAVKAVGVFLLEFLKKCASSKKEDNTYRKAFEAFVQDLLIAGDKPEWPAVHSFFCILCNLFARGLEKKDASAQFHLLCLRCLGLILSKVRSDAVFSQGRINDVIRVVNLLKSQKMSAGEEIISEKHYSKVEIVEALQYGLIDYLTVNINQNQDISDPRHYYLMKWYIDDSVPQLKESKCKKLKTSNEGTITGCQKNSLNEFHKDGRNSKENKNKHKTKNHSGNYSKKKSEERNSEASVLKQKQLLLSKMILENVDHMKGSLTEFTINSEDAKLICKYLHSCEIFSESSSIYLQYVICALSENCSAICAEAIKCLIMIVEADPSILGREDIQQCINLSLAHSSTLVREKTIDLIGKFILTQPDNFERYYDCIMHFIQDSGLSVRKRVIKIMEEICEKISDHHKIPKICAKVMERIYDEEESVRKQVMAVFYNMWFKGAAGSELQKRVHHIISTVSSAGDMGIKYLKELLKSMNEQFLHTNVQEACLAECEQILGCIIENVVNYGQTGVDNLIWSFRVLSVMATVWPQLFVPHIINLHTYLNYHCEAAESYYIVKSAAEIVEAVLPLVDYPSETFLSDVEECCIRNILQQHYILVKSSMSCLAAVVNNATHNYSLIRDCFCRYFIHLRNFQKVHEKNPEAPVLTEFKNFLRRSLYITGCFLRYFDFTAPELLKDLEADTVKQAVDIFMYFLKDECGDELPVALCGLGALCVNHSELMLGSHIKDLYHRFLTTHEISTCIKIQVLENIEMYLEDVEDRLIKEDKKWTEISHTQSLKERGEKWSGVASAVIQTYLKDILNTNFHHNNQLRYIVFEIVRRSLSQGLVDPLQVVPYLISATTDCDASLNYCAQIQLQNLHRSQSRALSCKFQKGLEDAQRLQTILQNTSVPRGARSGIALHDCLYRMVFSNRQSRNAFLRRLLQEFDVKGLLANSTNEEENAESLLARLPANINSLQTCVTSFHGLKLLLSIREHLQKIYSIGNSKISQYTPKEHLKLYEKSLPQQHNISFEPSEILNDLTNQGHKMAKTSERKKLVQKYLEFKRLLETDLEDPDISIGREHGNEEYIALLKNKMNVNKSNVPKSAPSRKDSHKRKKLNCKKKIGKKQRRTSEDETEEENHSSFDDISDGSYDM